jgi:AhpD family alkylhydroperoxidase
MVQLLGIGTFSRACHLSIRTLRHYHDEGLLVPAEIDRATGYRRYHPDQLAIALAIGRLRSLEREVVSLAAAFERHCDDCVAAHSAFAVGAGGDPADVEVVRRGRQPTADDRLAAEQALEVVGVLATATMANWTYALTEAPLDAPLAGWRWGPEEAAATPDPAR